MRNSRQIRAKIRLKFITTKPHLHNVLWLWHNGNLLGSGIFGVFQCVTVNKCVVAVARYP